MIDWLNLLFNSIWIFAMALALAVISIAYYQARVSGPKLSQLLNSARYGLPLNIAGAILCLGMGLTSDRWWEIMLWVVLLVLLVIQIYLVRKKL